MPNPPSDGPVSLLFTSYIVAVTVLLFSLVKTPAFGETLSVETSARLQASLATFLAEASSEDGRFSYLDRKSARS